MTDEIRFYIAPHENTWLIRHAQMSEMLTGPISTRLGPVYALTITGENIQNGTSELTFVSTKEGFKLLTESVQEFLADLDNVEE